MAARCHTCNHPNRELIDAELASNTSTEAIGQKWNIPGRTLREHRKRCMTQEQIARLRQNLQPAHEVDIEELVRRGGQTAVLGMSRLYDSLETACARCEKIGAERELATNRGLQLKILVEMAKQAQIYPTGKKVTNNTLVLSDGGAMFEMVGRILRANTIEEARRLYAAELHRGAQPALLEAGHIGAPLRQIEAMAA